MVRFQRTQIGMLNSKVSKLMKAQTMSQYEFKRRDDAAKKGENQSKMEMDASS